MLLSGKLRTVTLADGVENRLLEYIQSSGLVAGDLLPKEEELAEQLSVSRHIVREGVSRLKTLGLVESRKRKGMTLCRPDAFASVKKLAEANLFTKEECLEFMEMRVAMELGMVDYIYRRKTPESMQKLAEFVSDPLEYQRHLEQEVLFHQRLFAISGNSIANQFCAILNNAFKLLDYQPIGKRKTPSHKEIWETLDTGSLEDFRTVMLKHFSPYIK